MSGDNVKTRYARKLLSMIICQQVMSEDDVYIRCQHVTFEAVDRGVFVANEGESNEGESEFEFCGNLMRASDKRKGKFSGTSLTKN